MRGREDREISCGRIEVEDADAGWLKNGYGAWAGPQCAPLRLPPQHLAIATPPCRTPVALAEPAHAAPPALEPLKDAHPACHLQFPNPSGHRLPLLGGWLHATRGGARAVEGAGRVARLAFSATVHGNEPVSFSSLLQRHPDHPHGSTREAPPVGDPYGPLRHPGASSPLLSPMPCPAQHGHAPSLAAVADGNYLPWKRDTQPVACGSQSRRRRAPSSLSI